MTNERYMALERNRSLSLTHRELEEGWHFCVDWDGMLVGPGMDALAGCLCRKTGKEKPS